MDYECAEKIKNHRIEETIDKWIIKYWRWIFEIEKKVDGLVDIKLTHKNFDSYIWLYKQFKTYQEAKIFVKNFIDWELL